MRCSYERFFSKGGITKEQFFDFGMKETIYPCAEKATQYWEELKKRVFDGQNVYIRGFGRGGKNSYLYEEFYKAVLGHENVGIDSTNNSKPPLVIEELTKYSKRERTGYEFIRNYQVSHVFGRTKNVFAFTAPWNIVYIPKLLDPLTGHEAKGSFVDEYTKLFQKESYKRFQSLIEDYNEIMNDKIFREKIEVYISERLLDTREEKEFVKSVHDEINPIDIKD